MGISIAVANTDLNNMNIANPSANVANRNENMANLGMNKGSVQAVDTDVNDGTERMSVLDMSHKTM